MKTTYKFRGRPVHSTLGKVALVTYLLLFFSVCLLLSPILIPLHFVLKKMGRKGFTRWHSENDFSIIVDTHAFEKV